MKFKISLSHTKLPANSDLAKLAAIPLCQNSKLLLVNLKQSGNGDHYVEATYSCSYGVLEFEDIAKYKKNVEIAYPSASNFTISGTHNKFVISFGLSI